MKLNELRERLLGQNAGQAGEMPVGFQNWQSDDEGPELGCEATEGTVLLTQANQEPEDTAPRPEPKSLPLGQVAEPFWAVDRLDQRIQELMSAWQSVEALGQSAAKEFEALRVFQEQAAQLASKLEPMNDFCAQLGQLARTFEPLKSWHELLAGLPSEFRTHLLRAAQLLEPAQAFHLRVAQLAKAFEAVDDLAARFAELAEAFRPPVGWDRASLISHERQKETALAMPIARPSSHTRSNWNLS